MTKERVTFSWKVVAGQRACFITFRGPQAHNSSGFLLVLTQTHEAVPFREASFSAACLARHIGAGHTVLPRGFEPWYEPLRPNHLTQVLSNTYGTSGRKMI
jgi:hypothetical protein